MFCSKCGTKISDEAVFCYSCGKKVLRQIYELNDEKILIHNEKTIEMSIVKRMKRHLQQSPCLQENIRKYVDIQNENEKMWIVIVAAAIFLIIMTSSFYGYEAMVTRNVEKMRIQGENLALEKKIPEAVKLVDKSLKLRPNNKTLQSDKLFLKDGETISNNITNVEDFVKKQEYEKALDELEKASKNIRDKNGAIYDMLKQEVEEKKAGVTVLQIKSEMKSKNTIEDWGVIITKISSYNEKEAKDIVKQLRTKIADVSYTKASEFLKNNDFTSAINIIDEGLKYNVEDKKLISFKHNIVKQKSSFELEEQQRIEQAMISAAKEDENNRTNAVQVSEVKSSLNEHGDFVIKGKAKNVATKPISDIKLYYIVYDANNNELERDYTYVHPNYIEPNTIGEFQNTQYGIVNGHHIKISNITWYLG